MKKTLLIVLCFWLVGCVTAVDESLPYTELPEITIATATTLVASPSHPTAYLTADSILAGENVQVIGADESAAWLLVLHDNLLGWMPTFYSRTNVATLNPALVIEPLSDKCTKYLDATFATDEAWVSNSTGAVFVIGSIYRAQVEEPFVEAALDLEIKGGGAAVESDYIHTPLTPASEIVLFGFSVAGLQKGSQIRFSLSNSKDEALSFQAAFFSNECSAAANHLPVGKVKIVGEATKSQNDTSLATQVVPTLTTTPVIIKRESGITKPNPTATSTTSTMQKYVGIWKGETNEGGNWTVLLGLAGTSRGAIAGTIAYPSLRCGGELTMSSFTGTSVELSQDITYGNCVDNLIVVLKLQNESTLLYQEQHLDGHVTGRGILTKINPK